MSRAQAMVAVFNAIYGVRPGLSRSERKRYRKFTCTACGKKIPPGKTNRRCKKCHSMNIVRDESAPLYLTGDYKSTERRMADVVEKSRQMGLTIKTAQQLADIKPMKITKDTSPATRVTSEN